MGARVAAQRHGGFRVLLAPDYRGTLVDGTIETRADQLRAFGSGEVRTTALELSDVRMRSSGDLAVVSGLASQRELLRGQPQTFQFHYTRVWQKRSGRWQVIVLQSTPLQPVRMRQTPGDSIAQRNKALVRRYIEATNAQNNDDDSFLNEFIAPDFVRHGGREFRGLGSFRQNHAAVRAIWPDHQWTIEDIIAEGDKVVVRMTGRGTQRGEFGGIPATGKRVAFDVVMIYRIADGKITEQWRTTWGACSSWVRRSHPPRCRTRELQASGDRVCSANRCIKGTS